MGVHERFKWFIMQWSLDFLKRFLNPSILDGELRAEFLLENVELESTEASKFSNYFALQGKVENEKNCLMFKEVVNFSTLQYYQSIGAKSKAKQTEEDLLELWKYHEEDNFAGTLFVSRAASETARVFVEVLENFRAFSLPRM